MLSIIIRRRLLYLVLAVLFGAALISVGFLEIPTKLLKREKAVAVQNVEWKPAPRPDSQSAGATTGLTPGQAVQPAIAQKEDFFIEYRLDRERTRGRQIELLREIINSSAASEQARQKAQEELLAITDKLAREMELEHLLRARGYRDATVCIEGKGVTVIVQPGPGQGQGKAPAKITPEDIAKICEVVSWGTGVGEQNVIVIPKT